MNEHELTIRHRFASGDLVVVEDMNQEIYTSGVVVKLSDARAEDEGWVVSYELKDVDGDGFHADDHTLQPFEEHRDELKRKLIRTGMDAGVIGELEEALPDELPPAYETISAPYVTTFLRCQIRMQPYEGMHLFHYGDVMEILFGSRTNDIKKNLLIIQGEEYCRLSTLFSIVHGVPDHPYLNDFKRWLDKENYKQATHEREEGEG